MKIAIIGAGQSGLITYLFLKKHLPQPSEGLPHEYVVYEAYSLQRRKDHQGTDEIPLVGAGLGIGPNGMNVLRDLDEDLHDDIRAHGFPVTRVDFTNGRGWSLGSQVQTQKYGDRVEALNMISRQAALQSVLDRIPEGLIIRKSVAKVSDADGDQKAVVEFVDGSSESFHLVIGADGVRSTVRKAILDEQYAAAYTGLFGVGGFLESSLLGSISESKTGVSPLGQCVMTFGANGFFGYSPCSTAESVTDAHLLREDTVERGNLALWWSSFEREDSSTRNIDMDEQKQKLRERHKNWEDPAIRNIAQSEDLECIPTASWVMPKAPTWVGKRIVLVGDAAHALPSTSGQGISQAMLDGQALALLLSHHLSLVYTRRGPSEESALRIALEQYVQVRKPIVDKILDMANRMASKKKDMGFIEEMMTYGMLKVVFALFGNSMLKPVMEYDVKAEIAKVLKSSS